MTSEGAYESVVEVIDAQIEKLYEDESYLNVDRQDEEYTPDDEEAKWTYFQEFTISEQEKMERDLSTLFDDVFTLTEKRIENLISELTVVFEDASPPNKPEKSFSTFAARQKKKKLYIRRKKNDLEEEEVEQTPVVVCKVSEESDESCTPGSKCKALLDDIQALRSSVIAEMDSLLDTKFLLYRRSLVSNREKTHAKLSEARRTLIRFREQFELESKADMKERDRLVYSALEEKYQATITGLEEEVSRYISSVNLKTQRNLGLNTELNESKAINAQLTGKCERIYEDLTNSYKRCEFVEKNERISKRKLAELQKKFNALQKAAAKVAKQRGKLSRSNTMKSTNQLLQLVSDGEPAVDEGNEDNPSASQEPHGVCANCSILQHQLDHLNHNVKTQKSTDSIDRYSTFDRMDTGLSELSAPCSSPPTSKGGTQAGTPDVILAPHAQGESEGQTHVPEASQSLAVQRGSDFFSDPIITAEIPNVPYFDDHNHKMLVDFEVHDGTAGSIGRKENSLALSEEYGVNLVAVEEGCQVDGAHQILQNGSGANTEDGEQASESITFINDSEDVTSLVLEREVNDQHDDALHSEAGDQVEAEDTIAPNHGNVSDGDSLHPDVEHIQCAGDVTVKQSHGVDTLQQDPVEVTSMHSSQTSIVANISAVMTSVQKNSSHDLTSLEMTPMDDDLSVTSKKTKRKTKHGKHHQHHDSKTRPKTQQHKRNSRPTHTSPALVSSPTPSPSPEGVGDVFLPDPRDVSSRLSSILHSPSHSKRHESKEAINSGHINAVDHTEEVAAMKILLADTTESQRNLEKEFSALKEEKQNQDKYINELSGYIRTQDHIYNLKLKEREILLRELTQQTNDLRRQVARDKRMFDEMKDLADCNLPKLGIQKIKAKKLVSMNRKEEMQFFKLDLNSNDLNASARPATSGGLRAFHTGLPHPSQPLPRPDSSPALNIATSVHDFCGAASPSRPSQFSSTGINSRKIEQSSWREEKPRGFEGEDDRGVQQEVEEVRKKVALLVSHQDITMKRLRAKPGLSLM